MDGKGLENTLPKSRGRTLKSADAASSKERPKTAALKWHLTVAEKRGVGLRSCHALMHFIGTCE